MSALAALLVSTAAATGGFLVWNYPRGMLFAGAQTLALVQLGRPDEAREVLRSPSFGVAGQMELVDLAELRALCRRPSRR